MNKTHSQPVQKSDIDSRLRAIVCSETGDKGRFSLLETGSGVSANTWRTWWTRGNTPSGALVEAAARMWPEYAFWLATGVMDDLCGHVSPGLGNPRPASKEFLRKGGDQFRPDGRLSAAIQQVIVEQRRIEISSAAVDR